LKRISLIICFVILGCFLMSAALTPLTTGQAPKGNLEIQGVKYSPSYFKVKLNTTIEVNVRNDGQVNLTRIWVFFYINGDILPPLKMVGFQRMLSIR